MTTRYDTLLQRAQEHGQEHIFRFWSKLSEGDQRALLDQIESIDFALMDRLIETWIKKEPEAEHFKEIRPVPVIPCADDGSPEARAAWEAGEAALRAGRVGLFLVAGGQGTRLGFDGPKGAFPVAPLSGKTLFEYHADKIHSLQRRYGCTLPWYIMVSDTNAEETKAFFAAHDFFGLKEKDIKFLQQRMVPCVGDDGKFLLDGPGHLAMNPNGHGGCLPAMVENGVLDDARQRGIDILSYFQVDNWAVKVADPYFIGYHVLRNAEMSSKNHRKRKPRESVGVHCICDGECRIIEYSELDIYPQLLETDDDGKLKFYAGNPAIHVLSVDFVQRIYDDFDQFPWHRAHKKVAHLDTNGALVEPDAPNAYKFETFVFDALRFINHEPVALEITPPGEYTPIKSFEGDNSVLAARQSMANHWGSWIEEAGGTVPRDENGNVSVDIEINPRFALDLIEFLGNARDAEFPESGAIQIDEDGSIISEESLNDFPPEEEI